MLSLLLLYAITQSAFGEAVPISSIERRDDENSQTRTVWDIVRICLSTIFLCTWGSLHPNISSTQDEPDLSRRDKLRKSLADLLKYKLPLFLWALLIPEYILAWAIRQYITAGDIQKRVPGWSRTHGFFLIMGGFQLYERPEEKVLKQEEGGVERQSVNPGKFVRILEMADVREHQLDTIIPCTTKEDINDKAKSDGIAKAIIVLQASWFVVQCIARGAQHLPLTELEIITLAYAMMNSFIYFFWWDKACNVGCPIRVYENLTTSYAPEKKWESGFEGMLERVMVYVTGAQDNYVVLAKQNKVPIFWSSRYGFDKNPESDGGDTGMASALFGPSIFGMAFGAIHFIAWSHVFPSHAELILWRVSCIALVAVPLFSTLASSQMVLHIESGPLVLIIILAMFLLVLTAWLYVVARVATLVIAFTALRSLPSDALIVVDWTTFIPHF